MTLAGDARSRSPTGTSMRRHPRWSPEGQRIAYVSNEDGNIALWVLEVRSEASARASSRASGSTRGRWRR